MDNTMLRQRLVVTFVVAMTFAVVGYLWSTDGGPLASDRLSGMPRAEATLWLSQH